MNKYDHIVFDLGGVIEHIAPEIVASKFGERGMVYPEDFFSLGGQSLLCDNLEKGRCSIIDFIYSIGLALDKTVSNADILEIWNSNLLGISHSTLDVLSEIRRRKIGMSILSNTNVIHFEHIKKNFFETHNMKLLGYFENVFLSCDLGVRKPSLELSQHVIKEIKVSSEKILYIDDIEINCLAFKDLGVSTIHHTTNDSLYYLLDIL